jgi:PAS domain S-box-containing protein
MASPSAEQLPYFGPLLDHTEDAIVACDPDGRVTVWNEGAQRMYGWSAEEAIGRPETFFRVVENDEQHMERRRQLAEYGRWRGEIVVQRKDGSKVPVESISVAIRDEQGEMTGYLGIHRDITDRKHAEEALRAANRRTQAILERVSDTFFAVDDQWRYTYVNDRAVGRAREAWGREVSAEELLGKNCWELFPGHLGTAFDRELHRAVREQRVVEFETYSVPTGTWVEVRAYPSEDGLTVYSRDVTARRRGREARAYHASLLDNVEDGVIATDADDFRITAWNKGAERIYGFTAEEVLGRPGREVASYPGDEARDKLEHELLESGRTRIEFTAHRKEGAPIEVELIAAEVRNDRGEVTGYLGIHRDITERKRAERAFREARGRSETILESITDDFVAVDREWRYTYINDRALRSTQEWLGWPISREELLGRSLWEVFPETVGTVPYVKYHQAVREGRSVEFETYFAAKDRWFETHVYPSESGLSIYFRTITERKRAEEQLAYYARVVETMEDGVIATDDEFVVSAWNRGAQRLYGWTAKEALGRHVRDVVQTSLSDEELEARFRDVAEGGRARTELLAYRKDGATVWIEAITVAIRDNDGEITGYLGIHRDITERKQAEESLREAKRASETILESIGDDFIAVDRAWRITYMNQRALADSWKARGEQLSLDDVLGRSYWEVFPGTVGTAIDREFHRAVREQEIVGFEVVGPMSGVWFDICAYPTDHGLSVYARDITERKDAEQRVVRERGRIARALHDEALQSLSDAIAIAATADRTTAESRLAGQVLPVLRRVGEQLRSAIYDLRLATEEHRPFVELLEQLVDEHRAMVEWEIQLEIGDGIPSGSLGVEGIEVLRILGEALTNARRHAQARHVRVRVWGTKNGLRAEVSDDGRGFDPASPASPNHHGITGMRERAELLNGRLEIDSQPGAGTTVRVEAPLANGTSGRT